ncbi:MAG: SDR family oxidoreductase [Phycisphaerae bacterium]|nr:SDR family oxidoreductase [Phycisphaerae bacterium]
MPHTWLITGASRGIGLELARQAAARGDRVIAAVREPARHPGLAEICRSVVPFEATDDHSIAALGERLGGERLDVLINNAGVAGGAKGIEGVSGPELARVLRVNSVAPVLVVKAVLPMLLEGERRLVVNISSHLGSIGANAGGSSYSYRASKAALNMLTACMAIDLRERGVTCVAMHPGWVRTDMGGPKAPLLPAQAAADLLATFDRVVPADSGRFMDRLGETIPW